MSGTYLILCSGCCGASTEALPPQPTGSVAADDSYLSPFPPLLGSVCVGRVVNKGQRKTMKSCPTAKLPLGSQALCDCITVQLFLFVLLSSLPGRCGSWDHSLVNLLHANLRVWVCFLEFLTIFPATFPSLPMYFPQTRWAHINWSPQGPQQGGREAHAGGSPVLCLHKGGNWQCFSQGPSLH